HDRRAARLRPDGARDLQRIFGPDRGLAFSSRLPATATESVMASAMVAAIGRKPSKSASTTSIQASAIGAMGENTESVIETILAPLAWAAVASATVSLA